MMPSETWWKQLSELDEYQKKIIELPADGSFLVLGPPGSGKTNLLLLRANYLARTQHPNLLVIVFNLSLQNFIRDGADRYAFDAKCVQTIGQLFSSHLEEAGVTNEFDGSFEVVRQKRVEAVRKIMNLNRRPVFDTILLDESQDYLSDEILAIRAMCNDVFFVADSRQQIYSGTVKLNELSELVAETHTLPYHYRSGRKICQVADGIGCRFSGREYEPIIPNCNYPKSRPASSVELVQASIEVQWEHIAEKLRVQLRAYSDEMLAVITPRVKELREIASYLKQTDLCNLLCVQSREDGYFPLDKSKPIWVSTVHSAKGLEFGVVHFAGANLVTEFRGEQKRLAYTGVTRAKISLTVYYDSRLPPYFDSAFDHERSAKSGLSDIRLAFGDG